MNRKPKPQQGGDLLDHRKPQPETARAVLAILTARWIFLIKTIPNPREILWSDADAVVFDRETDLLPVAAQRNPNVAVRTSVAVGVADQIGERAAKKSAVGR